MIIDWISRVLGGMDPTPAVAGIPAGSASISGGSAASLLDSDELAAELARARRYEHDLAVVVLWARSVHEKSEEATRGRSEGARETRLPQMLSLVVAVALREVLRQCDIVCYHAAENRFVIGLPQTDVASADEAFRRIREHFRERLAIQVVTGIASFPADALTLDELVAAAETRAALGGVQQSVASNGNGHEPDGRETSSDETSPDRPRRRRFGS